MNGSCMGSMHLLSLFLDCHFYVIFPSFFYLFIIPCALLVWSLSYRTFTNSSPIEQRSEQWRTRGDEAKNRDADSCFELHRFHSPLSVPLPFTRYRFIIHLHSFALSLSLGSVSILIFYGFLMLMRERLGGLWCAWPVAVLLRSKCTMCRCARFILFYFSFYFLAAFLFYFIIFFFNSSLHRSFRYFFGFFFCCSCYSFVFLVFCLLVDTYFS